MIRKAPAVMTRSGEDLTPLLARSPARPNCILGTILNPPRDLVPPPSVQRKPPTKQARGTCWIHLPSPSGDNRRLTGQNEKIVTRTSRLLPDKNRRAKPGLSKPKIGHPPNVARRMSAKSGKNGTFPPNARPVSRSLTGDGVAPVGRYCQQPVPLKTTLTVSSISFRSVVTEQVRS
jgi:hypothetical protein